ncbi:MAG: hypothetical protein A4E66_00161 [Syntrophus sp. PtaB.Bin001]|nr:MAG: hypothetical protein A4E66_00161 [Syntrophus sp. PtaB.Bin001]
MDEIDRAQHYYEQYRQQALQAHYARLDTFFDAASTKRLTANSAPAIDGGGKGPEIIECIDCG